jgi:hypothetical protein
MPVALALPDENWTPSTINTHVPIWAVPQMRTLMARPGYTILTFRVLMVRLQESVASGHLLIEGEGLYYFVIHKSEMKTCPPPALYFEY